MSLPDEKNLAELVESYFGPAVEPLGRAAGLGPEEAERVLREGLPLQLRALAESAHTPSGSAQVAEALANLPAFPSASAALSEPDGAAQLQQAGELLAPVLLGDRANTIAAQVAGPLERGSVQKLLHLTLPLVLSMLGQRGLTADDLSSALPEVLAERVESAGAEDVLDFLRRQLSGRTAEQIGRAAGYSGNAAVRAVQGAWPVLLGGLIERGESEAGAAELLARRRDAERLVTPEGDLKTSLLEDPAEVARIEGQGRSLLSSLFANPGAVTGRFGSAVGGSGANASRLLALLGPLLMGLMLQRVGQVPAAELSRLLSSWRGRLEGLLPPGLGSLKALLPPPSSAKTVATAVTPPPRAAPAPKPPAAPPPTPREATPVPPASPTTPASAPARRGFPWWLLPLLLLGLGGCWLLQRQPATTPAGNTAATDMAGQSILVNSPSSGAALPAEDFVMRGTAPAGDTLIIEDEGQQVASVNVGSDGTWEAAIPAPTPGEHTYTIRGQDSGARSEFKVNVTGEGGGTAATTEDTADTGGAATGAATGAFAISEPASGAQLPAGGFSLRGTGTPGQTLQVLEDGTSLGNVTVAEDGTWSLDVPSPAAGTHTYTVQDENGAELGTTTATIAAAEANASAATCNEEYTLSITDGQTVSQPFRFGGVGQGKGYSVTVKRGDRVVGSRDVPLDNTCGWSYQSRPGVGTVTYEVRPLSDPAAAPLSTVTLTVTE
ncbi:DUF937 domain-containing protein [Deinococcus sp. YIM 77859]|uniref:DUF937 domain-containing protein n=1 Tax=Deinococcus sp. YIM 77859 TaxID=1540221 RepID=UPI000558F11F|nr:DUF937 domain-containing protein [Deinococcus sp. YIM 77859]